MIFTATIISNDGVYTPCRFTVLPKFACCIEAVNVTDWLSSDAVLELYGYDLYLRQEGYVSLGVCLSVCLITQQAVDEFWWNFPELCSVWLVGGTVQMLVVAGSLCVMVRIRVTAAVRSLNVLALRRLTPITRRHSIVGSWVSFTSHFRVEFSSKSLALLITTKLEELRDKNTQKTVKEPNIVTLAYSENTKHNKSKIISRKTDRAWFSRLLRITARKPIGSVLWYWYIQERSQRGGGWGPRTPLESKEIFLSVSCRSTKYGCVHSKTFKYFCMYTKRSGSRGGRGGCMVSRQPSRTCRTSPPPLRAISGYAPGADAVF